jgi:uncharacterized RDD family membrane protein YckC
MKCPKCGYLGFETVDRCRNCGYDFSLTPSSFALPELPMREEPADPNPIDDLSLIDAAAPAEPVVSSPFAPDLERMLTAAQSPRDVTELPLFGEADDDTPLISASRPPRPPLAVRRSTPEVPRLRSTPTRPPMLDFTPTELTPPGASSVTPATRGRAEEWITPLSDDGPLPAALGARFLATVVDLVILAVIDAIVVYFTMQICGLDLTDVSVLPKGPMIAFLLVQNGGYLVAFTAGGQTLGKMMAGIRVVPVRASAPLDLGRALVRTLVWVALAVPAGLGFLTAFMSPDRRALHDRCAGTRVVRAAA